MKGHRRSRRRRRLGRGLLLIPVIGLLIGIGIVSYPYFSQLYYQYLNEGAISSMTSAYDRYDPGSPEITEILTQAEMYNDRISGNSADTDDIWPYEDQLDLEGTKVMAYVEIPEIDVKMPVFHGTGEETLSAGAGHLEGTSLPIGGNSTHCVLTAHSGMKNMEAFDRLGLLNEGDLVGVTVIGRTLVYEVESMETVLPEETSSLAVIPGRDLLTLITCTPYGINDHRLLVHCSRTDRELTGEAAEIIDDNKGNTDSKNILKDLLFRNMRKIPVFATGFVITVILVSTAVKSIIRRKRRRKRRYRRNLSREQLNNDIIRIEHLRP